MRSRGLWLTATLVGLLLLVPVASSVAVSYATSGSPQYVSGYGSWGRSYGNWNGAKGTPTAYNKVIRTSLTSAHYRYHDADDHTVYVSMRTTTRLHTDANRHTNHANTPSSSWRAFTSRPSGSLYLDRRFTGSIKVSASLKTCLDIPIRPDVCSGASSVATTLTY